MRRPWVGWIAIAGAVGFSLAVYSRLPERMAIHWNVEFEPNGYASRLAGASVLPLLMIAIPVLVSVVVRMDPRRESHVKHRETLWAVINLVVVLLGALHVLMLGLALGWPIDSARAFPVLAGAVFVGIGNLMPRVRPNWFVGVRTPWTLSSDQVWRGTHRVSAWTMIGGGILLAAGGLQPVEWIRSVSWVVAVAVIAAIPIAYSYVLWVRLGRPKREARA